MRLFRNYLDVWVFSMIAHVFLFLAVVSNLYLAEWLAVLFGGLAIVAYGLALRKFWQGLRRWKQLPRIRITGADHLSPQERERRERQIENLAAEVRLRCR